MNWHVHQRWVQQRQASFSSVILRWTFGRVCGWLRLRLGPLCLPGGLIAAPVVQQQRELAKLLLGQRRQARHYFPDALLGVIEAGIAAAPFKNFGGCARPVGFTGHDNQLSCG